MSAINWFEIPVNDMERARTFYSTVLGIEMYPFNMGGVEMSGFPGEGVTGCLIKAEPCVPSREGALLYLNAGEDLSVPLGKIEAAGGEIVTPKTKVTDEIGYMAVFLDTEGNRVALHSPK